MNQKKQSNERLGIHCHSQVFEAVKLDAVATADRREKAVAAKDSLDYRRNRDAIIQEFPKITEESLTEILGHGFLKGSGRVGRAAVLDEKLRISLAVNAHIRHKLTPYDSLLATTSDNNLREDARRVARDQVHNQVHAIADSWREKKEKSINPKFEDEQTGCILAVEKSAKTLENNRSRRKPKVKGRTVREDHEERAIDKILSILKMQGKPKRLESELVDIQADSLDLVLDSLNLEEAAPLGKYQRRRAAVRADLLRLKHDPDVPMTKTRLAEVLKIHQSSGEDISSLGSAVVARAESEVGIKMQDRATRRARRETARGMDQIEAFDIADVPIPTSESDKRTIVLPTRRRKPRWSKSRKEEMERKRREMESKRERLEAKENIENENAVLVRGDDGMLTYARSTKANHQYGEPNGIEAPKFPPTEDVSRLGFEGSFGPTEVIQGDSSYARPGNTQAPRVLTSANESTARLPKHEEEASEWMDIS